MLRLRYTSFLNTSPKLDICTFRPLLKALSLCKILLKCQPATISDLPSYDIFVPQKVPLFKILMTSLHVICGLGLPTNQNSGHAYKLEIARKTFLKTFFFLEKTCGCVLGPWLWPREGLSSKRLSLASDFFVSLASSLVSSTPPLLIINSFFFILNRITKMIETKACKASIPRKNKIKTDQ